MIGVLLLWGSLAYIGFLVGIEIVCLFAKQPTISTRVRDCIRANFQVAALGIFSAGLIIGWFLAHVT
jgi:hypothetical protein